MSDPEDFIEEDDLFGDEDDAAEPPTRQLSDDELDSGDDEGRDDRAQDRMEVDAAPEREARVMDIAIARQTIPAPADGEVSSLDWTFWSSANRCTDSHISFAQIPRT